MEIERLVERMRSRIGYLDDQIVELFGKDGLEELMTSPIQLNRNRTIATAAKIIADDPTLPDDLAAALLQMCGAGGAKPYEVTDNA